MNNPNDIRLVVVDVDGTFVRDDYTYDAPRFKRIYARMAEAGCGFVVASGNQYYQLRDLFPGCCDELSFVAENGAFVKDRAELVFAAAMPRETVLAAIAVCREYPEVQNVLCGLESAYCERGAAGQAFFDFTATYYHRLRWADDLAAVDDQVLKFAVTVPEERTQEFCGIFRRRLGGMAEPTSSGHGSIDLILPGCHKASGVRRLAERRGITPEQCAAFGDGGNDVEMLRYCRHSYAMANAPGSVKAAARHTCPPNNEDGVLVALEELFPE